MSTEKIKEYIGTQLKALTSIASPTGFTKNATDYLMKQLEAMGYAPQLSNKGNVSVEIGGVGAPLVLAAHVDTLGAMVRSIKDNGRLRPTTIGGHQWSTADGENCMVFTRDGRMYTGVVLNTEPSAHVADEKVETKEENMEILLDENVNDKQGVAALGIQTGDIIAMDPRTVITESGYIKSRFLDDKLSVAILLGYAKYLKEEKAKEPIISDTKTEVVSEQKRKPPKEGSIPAKIETVGADGKEIFAENYRIGYAGQCTWYARGRFREVNGVELPSIGYAKDWLMAPLVSDKVDVCLDVNVVPEHSIAVYAPKTDNNLKGHVVFVEYVERDKDGNPVNVY